MQKAYDSVHWDFLFGVLLAIGTLLKFVSWVSACITSSVFSVLLNRSLQGYFPGRRDLRQEDPLFPYLFFIVMEVQSRMLNARSKGFGFHPRCERIGLTHLCFSDDLMIFCVATRESLSVVQSVLERFHALSEQQANFSKSFFLCARISESFARSLP